MIYYEQHKQNREASMNTVSKVIITTLIVVVVVIGGWWLISSMSSNNNEMNNGSSSNESGSSQVEPDAEQEAAATITYSGTEFTPLSTTIQSGDVIEIMNESSNVLFFASDDHPLHRDNSELNVGDIQPGSSATFTISTSGTWGYHDHNNASASGEIVVE